MKKMQFEKSKEKNILNGKGFYVALAVSLLAVAVATFFAVNQSLKNSSEKSLKYNDNSAVSEWGTSPSSDAAVNQIQSDVPANETPASSESSAEETKPTETVYAMPLSGEIINEFSQGELVKSSTLGDWRTHDGIDIKAEITTPVKSIANGIVTEIYEDAMWGNCILVDHQNGYVSHYYGLSNTVNVKVDQEVKLGDVLGAVGDTAQCEIKEEPHLHFGLKKDGEWVDPLSVIQQSAS